MSSTPNPSPVKSHILVTNEEIDAKLMPPPPDPLPKESKFLQPEFDALSSCLKEIIVKTGQIYNFYAETHKLGIQQQAPYPSRSLTGALGREVEKYDQFCDSIASSINKTISILKHELATEQEKKRREQEAESQRMKAELEKAAATAPSSPVLSTENLPSDGDTSTPLRKPHNLPVRRQSAISFSSLQRPAFPLKLDLSSPSLRLSEEDASLYSKEPASPVTLAPKSARPIDAHEFQADFMAAFASSSVQSDMMHPPELDLSTMHLPQKPPTMLGGVGLGDSSDKPIELDLESMDMEISEIELFGEHPDSAASSNPLFAPPTAQGSGQKGTDPQIAKVDDLNLNPELFGEFTANPELAAELLPQENASVPSPGTLMAQLTSSQFMGLKESTSTEGTENFNLNSIDLSHLASGIFNHNQDAEIGFPMDMDSFMAMDGNIEEKSSQEPSASHPQ